MTTNSDHNKINSNISRIDQEILRLTKEKDQLIEQLANITTAGENIDGHARKDIAAKDNHPKTNNKEDKECEEKFKDIFHATNDGLMVTDLEGNFLEINNIIETRSGYSKSKFMKMNIRDLIINIPEKELKEYFQKLLNMEQPSVEVSYRTLNGKEVNLEVNGSLINYQNQKAFLHRSIDITERKATDRQIQETIIKTEEKERSRFARDLHEGLAPYLSTIKLFLRVVSQEQTLSSRNAVIQKIYKALDEIILTIKDLSNNISPHILKHFGLVPALNAFSKRRQAEQLPMRITTNIESIRLNEDLEMAIFRIITELFNNTLKYAKANHIDISIMKGKKKLEVIFTHDGKGFNFSKAMASGKAGGLYYITNRVNALNGKYKFNTEENTCFEFKAVFENK